MPIAKYCDSPMFRDPASGMTSPCLLFFFQAEQNYPMAGKIFGEAQIARIDPA